MGYPSVADLGGRYKMTCSESRKPIFWSEQWNRNSSKNICC